MENWASQTCPVEIAPILRFCPCRSEIVSGIQIFIAKELDQAAMKRIRPRAGGHVYNTPIEAAELGWHIVCFDSEPLYVVEAWEERYLTGFGLQCRNAI